MFFPSHLKKNVLSVLAAMTHTHALRYISAQTFSRWLAEHVCAPVTALPLTCIHSSKRAV